MNSLDKIKADYQKGRMNINDIGWVIQKLETEQMKNKELTAEIRNLKAKTRFKVYQENLSLIEELKIVTRERDEYKAPFMSLRFADPDRRIREHA